MRKVQYFLHFLKQKMVCHGMEEDLRRILFTKVEMNKLDYLLRSFNREIFYTAGGRIEKFLFIFLNFLKEIIFLIIFGC